MRHTNEAQGEWLQLNAAAGGDDIDADLVGQPHFSQLAAQHGSGELRAVDRTFQLRPQPGYGTDVIFMGVRDDQTDQLVAPVGDEPRVGHHHLDLWQLAAAKANATIHRQPFFVSCRAPAVQVQVHADFARPTQGQEGQFAGFRVHIERFVPLFRFDQARSLSG